MSAIGGQKGALFQQGLMDAMFLGYEEEFGLFEQCVNKNKSKRRYEEWTGIVGSATAPQKTIGQDMDYDSLYVETPTRVQMQSYAQGLRIHLEDYQDDQTGALKQLANALGRAQKSAREVFISNFFNGAFITTFRTGYDNKALCTTDHPLQGSGLAFAPAVTDLTAVPARSGTTWSNELATAADLDYTSLIDAITLLRRTVTREGDYTSIKPDYLLVPPELEHTAYEVTKSTDRPDTANRSISSLNRHGIGIKMSPYLIDTDAWFLVGDRHDIQFFDRMPYTLRKRDAEGSWDMLVESYQRFGGGFHDPRGIVGTPGA